MMHPILKNETEILDHLKKNMPPYSSNFLCFYSSHLKAFITDPLFINIPLEDKMVHRGYGVFETMKVFGNKIYQLDSHIERFTKSINKIGLKSIYSKDEYREIIMMLSGIARKIEPTKDIELRYFYSAGLGNMNLVVEEAYMSFYAVAYKTDFSERPFDGVNERLVNVDQLRSIVRSSKNTNYLVNCMVTKQSRDDGGYLGIMTDDQGNILESPISNVAFVLENGDFNVPPFEKTLVGTTVVRVMEYVTKELITKGLVKNINRDYLNAKELEGVVKEAMLVGGDFVIPILKINDFTINSEPGPVTRLIQEFLNNDQNADEVAEEIPELRDF